MRQTDPENDPQPGRCPRRSGLMRHPRRIAAAALFAAAVATSVAAMTGGSAAPAGADTWEPTPPTTQFPGSAAPPSGDKAQTLINDFQSSGYKVILNRIGSAPLDQCTVTSVTPGQQVTQLVTSGGGGMNAQVLFTTVYVTADCTHLPKKAS